MRWLGSVRQPRRQSLHEARLSRSFRQEIIEALPSFGKAAVPLLTEIFQGEARDFRHPDAETASPMSAGFCVSAWRLEKPLLRCALT